MPYFVYKITKSGRKLLAEYLYLNDAKRKARGKGRVVVDELGRVVQE